MILSDKDIKKRLNKKELKIEPLNKSLQIQPASVDLRLGNEFLEFLHTNISFIRASGGLSTRGTDLEKEISMMADKIEKIEVKNKLKEMLRELEAENKDKNKIREYTETKKVGDNQDYILHPGDFVLGTTEEKVTLPDDLVARVEGRSSLGRLAIVVHATAGYVDPGFRGNITLELSNLGKAPISLQPGMRVAQIVFEELKSPAQSPYGEKSDSKYQDQSGPTESKIEEDKEWKN